MVASEGSFKPRNGDFMKAPVPLDSLRGVLSPSLFLGVTTVAPYGAELQ